MGREHYLISTEKVANDLLRTRGSIYSSRENLPAASIVLSDNLRPLFFDNDGVSHPFPPLSFPIVFEIKHDKFKPVGLF